MKRRILTTGGTALTAVALSASVALGGGGVSGTAKGHGQAVSEVAKAAEAVSGKSHGEIVSAIAKQHGAAVSAAARAQGAANAAAGKGKGADKSAEGKETATTPPSRAASRTTPATDSRSPVAGKPLVNPASISLAGIASDAAWSDLSLAGSPSTRGRRLAELAT